MMDVAVPKMSSDYEWRAVRDKDGDLVHEVWETDFYEFDIAKAKRIIRMHPRLVTTVGCIHFLGVLELLIVLEPKHRRVEPDLNFPVIVGTMPRGGTILIDGWHRLDAAVRQGKTELPAVFLTAEETRKVRRRL